MSSHAKDNEPISVQQAVDFPEAVFTVTVREGSGETMHTVSLTEGYYNQLTDGQIDADKLILHSFRFLLEREPKESILPEFDLRLIARYYPEFEHAMKGSE